MGDFKWPELYFYMKMIARAATAQDKSLIYELYEQAMKAYIEAIWGWDQSWQDNDFNLAYTDAQTYVIEQQSEVLGYFQVDVKDDYDFLRMLIIKPQAQSQGFGSKVLAQLLRIAHRNGKALLLRVFKINPHAKRFYQREGWTVCAEQDVGFLMDHPSNAQFKARAHCTLTTTQSYVFAI